MPGDILRLPLQRNPREYAEKKLVVDDFGERSWGSLYDFGHMTSCENETMYDSVDPESCQASGELLEEIDNALTKHGFRLGHILSPGDDRHAEGKVRPRHLGTADGRLPCLVEKDKERVRPERGVRPDHVHPAGTPGVR